MKLMFINYGALPMPPVKGGAVEHLIDMFLRDNEVNHSYDITVVSIYDEQAKDHSLKYNNCNFEYISLASRYDKTRKIARHLINRFPKIHIGNAYISKVIRQIKNFNEYDAVIVENAPEFGLLLQKVVKGRLILHLHNDYLNKKTKLANKIFESFDEIYTLSDFVGDRVREISDSNKIKTLHNGIELDKFNDKSRVTSTIRQQYGIEKDDLVIMYSGRIVPEKGVKELLQAFVELPKKQKIKLVIVGSAKYGRTVFDEYLSSLKKISEPFNDQVIFTGYIPYEEMPQLYSIADIGMVPSLCNDGFNLTVVEYMANSAPVIVSDKGAMNELITPECGIVVSSKMDFPKEITKAIELLINDKEKYNSMKQKALNQSKKFSDKNYIRKFNFLLSRNQ